MNKIKPEMRILGIDDSPFSRNQEKVLCVGTIYRGGNYLDGLISFYVDNDGNDATLQIIKNINKTRHKEQLQLIMLDGISFAGFNMININKIWKKTKIPVMIFTRKKPDLKKFKKALSKIDKKRLKAIQYAGKIYKLRIRNKNKQKLAYIQIKGLTLEQARKILKLTCNNSNIPEPLRVAHLIAQGIVFGESKGSA
jgi:hypothetical protein